MSSKVSFNSGATQALIDNAGTMADVVTFDLLLLIKELSPVDTGEYRDSWRAEIDQDVSLIYNIDSAGNGKLVALENGHSGQAPQGILRPAVASIKNMIVEHTRKVK